MKRLLSRTIAIIIGIILMLIIIFAVPIYLAYASDISEAKFKGTIYVTNNSTANTSISVPFTLNTQHLIENSYTNSSANDCAIRTEGGSDIAFMPGHSSSSNWTVFVPSITDHELLTYLLYTGNVTDGKLCYFPGDEGMTTSDDADLEGGDNFTVEQTAWVDVTSVGANLTSKDNAFRLYVSGSGNITASIESNTPTGHDDPGGNWANETNAYDLNEASYAIHANIGSSSWSSYLEFTRTSNSCTAVRYIAGGETAQITQIDVDAYYDGDWQDVYQGAFTQGVWETKDIASSSPVTEARVRLYNNHGANPLDGYIYEFEFISSISATATGLSSGEITARAWADTSDLHISIGGVESDNTSLGGFSMPDNTADWDFMQGVAYMEQSQIWVDGVLEQDIIWEYTSGDFTDQSGNDHDATPTFRTASSDPDVSAELVAWEAVSPAEADPVSIEEAADMVTTAPDAPAQMYDEMNVSHLPLANDLINPLLADAEIPQAMFWLPLAFGTAILAGFGVYAWTKSLLAQVIASMFVMGFWVATGGGVVPAWVFIPFVLEAVAIIMMKKTPAPW